MSRLSVGRYKPTSIAGYERGERSITLERFCDLCRLYEVDPSALLAEILQAAGDVAESGFDVERLESLGSAEAAMVAGFVREIRTLRRGRPSDAIVLRAGDVEVLATAAGRRPEDLVEVLGLPTAEEAEVQTEPDGDESRDADARNRSDNLSGPTP